MSDELIRKMAIKFYAVDVETGCGFKAMRAALMVLADNFEREDVATRYQVTTSYTWTPQPGVTHVIATAIRKAAE